MLKKARRIDLKVAMFGACKVGVSKSALCGKECGGTILRAGFVFVQLNLERKFGGVSW